MSSGTQRKRTISEAGSYGGNGSAYEDAPRDNRWSGGGDLRRRRIGGLEDDQNGGDGGFRLPRDVAGPRPPEAQSLDSSLRNPPGQQRQKSVVPLSMHIMRPFWLMSCCPIERPDCPLRREVGSGNLGSFEEDFFAGTGGYVTLGGRGNVSLASFGGMAAVAPTESQHAGRDASGRGNDSHNSAVERSLSVENKSVGALHGDGNEGHTNVSVSNVGVLEQWPHAKQHISPGPPPSPERSQGRTTGSTACSNDGYRDDENFHLQEKALIFGGEVTVEHVLREYAAACHIYGCSSRLNPGVLTTLRFSLPTLRVSGSFFDADMLALAEVLLKHCNGALGYIKRLDFTIAGKEGKNMGKKGIRSHGAYALSKVLSQSECIEEVYLVGNRIGSYGCAAIFSAATENAKRGGRLRTLLMRGCRVGERGALAFAEEIRAGGSICKEGLSKGGLKEVDLSACRIGFNGCFAIGEALRERNEWAGGTGIKVDLEANMVFQEVMNCITHGLGILLGTVGTYLLNKQVSGMPSYYTTSCAIYSISVIVLYTSSTLYHSFFALQATKFVFQVFDKSAIYLLIAGSYTPFLTIALHHEPLWSLHLLLFIWACAISGVFVEATLRTWKHKGVFSLVMYLGMGWSCVVCLPDLVQVLPVNALALMVAGGVSYTGGVPFFVRNNNLDHSIWHLFVLAGSIFHWLCVFWYVAIPGVETQFADDNAEFHQLEG